MVRILCILNGFPFSPERCWEYKKEPPVSVLTKKNKTAKTGEHITKSRQAAIKSAILLITGYIFTVLALSFRVKLERQIIQTFLRRETIHNKKTKPHYVPLCFSFPKIFQFYDLFWDMILFIMIR